MRAFHFTVREDEGIPIDGDLPAVPGAGGVDVLGRIPVIGNGQADLAGVDRFKFLKVSIHFDVAEIHPAEFVLTLVIIILIAVRVDVHPAGVDVASEYLQFDPRPQGLVIQIVDAGSVTAGGAFIADNAGEDFVHDGR